MRAEEQGFVRMYMVNPLTGTGDFNISASPVGSDFTVEFYIGNVTDLITWQIYLTYNRTLIHYAKAWFPDDNVFKEAVDKGATPLAEVSNNVDQSTDVGDLLIVMTSTYPPSSSLQYPVSVESKGLLCKLNFTVTVHPACTQLDFISTLAQSPTGLHVFPPYHIADYGTSVETLDGTHSAGGDPAVIRLVDSVPESPLMVLLIGLPATLTLILAKKRRPAS
jgi:hypothetical protein